MKSVIHKVILADTGFLINYLYTDSKCSFYLYAKIGFLYYLHTNTSVSMFVPEQIFCIIFTLAEAFFILMLKQGFSLLSIHNRSSSLHYLHTNKFLQHSIFVLMQVCYLYTNRCTLCYPYRYSNSFSLYNF